MEMQQLIEKFSSLGISDIRFLTDKYVELVFYNEEIDKWNMIFVDIFGPAIKPSGVEPTKDDLSLTKDYGGIWNNQTLFKKELEDVSIISMFWPWRDNVHTTLKIALLKK